MLTHLDIRNIVLIDHLSLDMQGGFSVLTGETGAGKSILLDALGLLRGVRADTALIRKGTDAASVQAAFDVPEGHPVFRLLSEQGITADTSSPLILRRVLSADGKSRAFINNQAVSIGFLKTIACALMDIHGQFETSDLFDPAQHRTIVDEFGRLEDFLADVAAAWQNLEDCRALYNQTSAQMAQARADEDYLRASYDDLVRLAPRVGEEADLVSCKQARAARAQIEQGLSGAFDLIEGEEGADMRLATAARILDRLRPQIPDRIEGWLARLDQALASMRDIAQEIESFARGADEHADLSDNQVEDRLYDLRQAARRHHCLCDDLPARQEDMAAQLSALVQGDEALTALAADIERAMDAYTKAAKKLSTARKKAAQDLDTAVQAELPPLKLERARFETHLTSLPMDKAGPGGLETVRFVGTMNTGTAMGPLDKIASGGELSRLMLAIKVALFARAPHQLCLIFDEVDSGVGGAVAAAMAQRLARLSKMAQVMAVTHAPQVAACADHHFIVFKKSKGDTTSAYVQKLEQPHERREEIARMLSGEKITNEARAAADKLLDARAA